MIETRRGDKYQKEFHDTHPNTIQVESTPFKTLSDLHERVYWTEENFLKDAMMDFGEKRKVGVMTVVWFCESEIDAMAAKLRWGE